MQSSDTARILLLERAFAAFRRAFGDTKERVGRLEQLVPAATPGGMGGMGGGGTDIYWAKAPSTGAWAATGTFPTITPDSFTADVYTLDDTPTLEASDATVYYHSSVTLAVNSLVVIKANGDGTYSVINVMCVGS